MRPSYHLLGFLLTITLLSFTGVVDLAARQEGTIKGVVIDSETRQPIPMVNIYVRGTNLGTATDERGAFQIKIPASKMQVMAISHIGYKKEAYDARIDAGEELDVTIELEPEAVQFREVTVTAKTPFEEASANYIITEKDIERTWVYNFQDVLRRSTPQIPLPISALAALRGQSNFTLYVDNVHWDPVFLDTIDPYTVKKVLVWRSLWAPIYFRTTSGSRYVIHVITK